jgi:RNase P/RNase MRP subunit p29
MNIEEFAQAFVEAEHQAIQQDSYDALEQIEAPGMVFHLPPAPDLVGFEAHKQYLVSSKGVVSGFEQEWEYIVGDGDVAVLSVKQQMTFTAEHPVLKIPAGAKVTTDGFMVLRRENDRVAEIWTHSNIAVQ